MINKENLLAIGELNLSGRIDEFDRVMLDEYVMTLSAFVESFPVHEAKLKESFETGDNESFSRTLLIVKDLLIKIYADSLVQSCEKLIGDVNVVKHEVIEAYLNYFLTTISALSIDIQMASYGVDKKYQALEAGAAEPDSGTVRKAKLIVAVDDSTFLLNSIKMALKDSPYKFVGLLSGDMALKYLENNRPDLFFLDIEMPEMDGYELAQRIRDNGHTAPIIFLTGNSSKEYVLKAIQSGADDFIVKPINAEKMLEKINAYVD